MVFQEPSTALNPVYTVGWQIGGGLRAHGKYRRRQATAQCDRACWRGSASPTPSDASTTTRTSSPAARSSASSSPWRSRSTPELHHRRRADDRARCDGAGRDPRPAAPLPRRVRHRRSCSSPTTWGSSPTSADRVGRDVRGRDRRARRSAADLFSAPAASSTPSGCWLPYRGVDSPRERARDSGERAPVVVGRRELVIEYPGRFGRERPFRAVDGVTLRHRTGRGARAWSARAARARPRIGRAIGGLTKVAGGSLQVLGARDARHPRARSGRVRGDIGFVFQDPASSFNPLLTIARASPSRSIVARPRRDAAAARPRVDELLEAVQLPEGVRRSLPARVERRASASGRASPGPSPSTRLCSSPTSPRARSTCRCRPGARAVRRAAETASGSRPCSSATTSRSSTCCPTASRCCIVAAWSRRARAPTCSADPSIRTLGDCWRHSPYPTRSSRPFDASDLHDLQGGRPMSKTSRGAVDDRCLGEGPVAALRLGQSGARSIAVNGCRSISRAGEVLAVVGETGSGKSTLAKAVGLVADRSMSHPRRSRVARLSVLGTPIRGISGAIATGLPLTWDICPGGGRLPRAPVDGRGERGRADLLPRPPFRSG